MVNELENKGIKITYSEEQKRLKNKNRASVTMEQY